MGTLKNNEFLLKSSTEFPCSYIKGNSERRVFVNISYPQQETEIVSTLTSRGFRRNYNHMYIPICKNCNSCIPSRIDISKFSFTKSNKRNLNINKDLNFVKNQKYDHKRFILFKNYCEKRHANGQMKNMTEPEFFNFFHKAINKTSIFDLIDENEKLLGSILLDNLDDGFSAVYSFFDPSLNTRGLGKNIILQTIKMLKEIKKSYLYLGFWVKESNSMNYKSSFNSVELFENGKWELKS